MIDLRSYRCCSCGKTFAAKDAEYTYKKSCICRGCSDKLERTGERQRFFGDFYNDYTFSPFYYDGLFREIFLGFKFRGNRAFGHLLGMAAGECLRTVDELYDYDCIVPVPLSKERYNERGYNQSEIMARYIAEAIRKETKPYLQRIKHGPAQSTAVGVERMNNIIGSFRAEPETAGKKIILFDDVHTTGSTLHECERTLREAGAADVCLVTAAYVYRPPKNNVY